MTVTKRSALPASLPPRLIGLAAAAAYVDVAPGTFLQMVARGAMPQPKRLISRRKAWDVREIDRMVDELPIDGEALPDDTWSDGDAA